MATFHYKAFRSDQTPVEGQLRAEDLKTALVSLESEGLLVSSIREVPDTRTHPAATPTADALALGGRQFSRVLETGRPLASALLAYAQELPRGRRRRRLERIANQLEQGHDPAHTLGSDPIDAAWIPLLSASAASGDPSSMLRGIIGDSQHSGDLRRQFVSALAYPLLLLACLILLVVMFAWWLVPTFREIFMDFGTELPAATMLVLGFSETIRESRGLVFVIPLLLLAGGIAAFQFRPRSSFWDWTLHRVPVLGATLRLADGARFTRHLANLVEAEVPVADALRISGRDTNQASLRREVNELATEIELGDSSLRESLPEHRILPKTVVHVLSLKTKHQAAVQILRELSWMYEQQTRNRLDWFASVFGPVSVLFLGAVIGFYIIALFLPLIFLIQNLT